VALFAQPGTTLMRLACIARIPARTTGAGCIIKCFNAGVIFCCAAVANPVSDMLDAGARLPVLGLDSNQQSSG
jgi:hypothetical protein